jgi:uncharacterized protein YwgA
MTEYQLAKLVQMAGSLKTRKRLQKATYLLQAAGCPLAADFILHLYGPYSHEVAYLADALTARGVLREEETPLPAGREYTYELELAATMVLFRGNRGRWDDAVSQTADFKDVKPTEPILVRSRELAESVLPRDTA